jgi:hypothetical protein
MFGYKVRALVADAFKWGPQKTTKRNTFDGLSLLQLFPTFRRAIQKGAGFAVEKLHVLGKKSAR